MESPFGCYDTAIQSVVYDWNSYCVCCCWISQHCWSLATIVALVNTCLYKQLRRLAAVSVNSSVGLQLCWSTKNQILYCCSLKDHQLEVMYSEFNVGSRGNVEIHSTSRIYRVHELDRQSWEMEQPRSLFRAQGKIVSPFLCTLFLHIFNT